MKYIKILLVRAGVDSSIALTISGRIIQAAGGIISLFFIATFLDTSEQGFYYTFGSVLAINIFFELGLAGIITQYVAHEFAHFEISERGIITGDIYHISRAASLLHFCIKWFGMLSIILLVILLLSGYFFFGTFSENSQVDWEFPWLLLSVSAALNLFIDPILAFFDGLGQVKDMAKVRLIQRLAYMLILFIFFSLGFKLYSSAIASIAAILINYCQILFSNRRGLLQEIWNAKTKWIIDYKKEIFPFQWRIALSWISGYFIFQLFNPVLFATEGPSVAGQMGMTLQALAGISALSMSWITTKIPLYSLYVAKKEYTLLDQSFNLSLLQLCIINFLMICTLFSFLFALDYYDYPLSQRFLPLLPSILLGVVTFSNQFIFSWATYLRCHKQEPFLNNSVVCGILCALSTVFLGKTAGLLGIVMGYAFISVVIALPWAYIIYRQKKNAWHEIKI